MTRKSKTGNGGGTIRKRTDGRWEARYTHGFDAESGKQIQKSVYGKTQSEVRKKLQAICTLLIQATISSHRNLDSR